MHQDRVVTSQTMANSQATADLKNFRIKNPSWLFRPLVQYLRSNKRWVLSPGVTDVQQTQYFF